MNSLEILIEVVKKQKTVQKRILVFGDFLHIPQTMSKGHQIHESVSVLFLFFLGFCKRIQRRTRAVDDFFTHTPNHSEKVSNIRTRFCIVFIFLDFWQSSQTCLFLWTSYPEHIPCFFLPNCFLNKIPQYVSFLIRVFVTTHPMFFFLPVSQ